VLAVHRPAKVRDLHRAVQAHEDVLRLQVAVDDVLAVAVVQRLGQGFDVLVSERPAKLVWNGELNSVGA
jgi:hypothetical protein